MFETQGGDAELNPRPSEEGVSFYLVLRPLDDNWTCTGGTFPRVLRDHMNASLITSLSASDAARHAVAGTAACGLFAIYNCCVTLYIHVAT